jgi:AbrB family looped-hinge helix DNA binding protein
MVESQGMTNSEIKALRWLLSQGIPKDDIRFSRSGIVDFTVEGKGFYEVKRIVRGGIYLTDRQARAFSRLNPTVVVFDDVSEEPLIVAPFSEVKDKVKLWGHHVIESEEFLRVRVKVEDKCRVTIPKDIRDLLKIKDGSVLEMYPLEDNKVVMEVLIR